MTIPISIIARPDVDIAHHRVHEGDHFVVHKITTGLTVVKYFLIITPLTIQTPPQTTQMHLIFNVTSDLGIELDFFENAIVSANGTQLNPMNSNRNSTTLPLAQVFENPTVVSEGLQIFEDRIGTATSGGIVGEIDRDEEELVLKVETQYLLKITPLFGAINITTELNWYDARPASPVSPI